MTQIWLQKPDGGPGWAQYFYQNGHPVHVVDLPHATCPPVEGEGYNIEYPYTVQNEYTCPSQRPQDVRCAYNQVARTHDKWPGVSKDPKVAESGSGVARNMEADRDIIQTGRVNDPIFRNYYDSRVMLRYTASYRQATSQLLLAEVLDTLGKALIIAEGTGCQMAWLAADIRPERVAGIISVEPAGPPFGSARDTTKSHNHARWLRSVKHNQNVRRWGLTDVPLSYDPPLPPPEDILNEPRGLPRLNICLRHSPEVGNGQGGLIWLQADGSQFGYDRYDSEQSDGEQPDCGQFVYEPMISDQSPVRKLHNLAKFPHVVVTAPASQHSLFDHATVAFMRQAGLQVTWERLEKRGILGNGTLMFLETNSDDIAHVISENIQRLGLCPGDAANKTK